MNLFIETFLWEMFLETCNNSLCYGTNCMTTVVPSTFINLEDCVTIICSILLGTTLEDMLHHIGTYVVKIK